MRKLLRLPTKSLKTLFGHNAVLNSGATRSFIKPDRLPKENITNSIVSKSIEATKDTIISPEIIGVLRWNESPNAEKDITIVKEANGQAWIIIAVTNIAEGAESVHPIVEEYKKVETTVITTIVTKTETSGPSEEVVKDSEEVESVTSGVIHDGEAYQIDHNVKEEKLSSQVKKLIKTIKEHEDVDKLPGRLYNIEQHSDGVATEFSFNYVQDDGSFTRYFVIKEINGKKNVFYMGSDSTNEDPKDNIYFKPTYPLEYSSNHEQYQETIRFVEERKGIDIDEESNT